jgi:hypothetical protein
MSGLLPGLAPSGAPRSPSRGSLRLLDGLADAHPQAPAGAERAGKVDGPVPAGAGGYVLVAGLDGRARGDMLGELRDVLPDGTRFVQTRETWEALTLAEGSKMVVLADDLVDLSGPSVVRLLARRQPNLPVLAVRSRAPSARSMAARG